MVKSTLHKSSRSILLLFVEAVAVVAVAEKDNDIDDDDDEIILEPGASGKGGVTTATTDEDVVCFGSFRWLRRWILGFFLAGVDVPRVAVLLAPLLLLFAFSAAGARAMEECNFR